MIKAGYPLSYNELGLAPSKHGGMWSDGSAALGEAIEGVTATDDSDPLSKAVRGDHLECAEMLILAGANLNGYKDSSPRPMTYFSRTKSAAMFDLLLKHGLQPVKDDLWVRSDTDPELVKRFMDTGIPAQGKHIRDGSVWLELLRSPREVGLKEENVLKIGHILMDAGYPPSGTTLFPFFSLRIFMKLNLDPKLMPHLVEKSILYGNHWNSFSPLPGSEAIEPGNSREQNMFLLKTLDEYGMDTGLFWDKEADITVRRAMLEIGIVPENGEGGSEITNKEIAQAQAVRLQNKSIHTSKTAHRPRRI